MRIGASRRQLSLYVAWRGAVALSKLGLLRSRRTVGISIAWTLTRWSPFEAARTSHLTWIDASPKARPEMLAGDDRDAISLVTKVIEHRVCAKLPGTFDASSRAWHRELIAALFGGLTIFSLQTGTRPLAGSLPGGATRRAGRSSVHWLLAARGRPIRSAGTHSDPIIAGLVLYLATLSSSTPFKRHSLTRPGSFLLLAVTAMMTCASIYGLPRRSACRPRIAPASSCINYARFGAVHRHVTAPVHQLLSNVQRRLPQHLRENGDAIQLYWLSGYIFFGSSEGIFERIRSAYRALPPGRVSLCDSRFGLAPEPTPRR